MVESEGPVVEGGSVTLLCQSRANPPITNYTWYKDGAEDEEAGSVLVLNSIGLSHSGSYHCTVKNELGEDVSAEIQLDVQCKFTSYRKDID